MDDRIKNALDQLHASEDLKSRTLQQIQARTARPRRRTLPMALAFCALLLAVVSFGGWLYLAPVSSINIDINPSLELKVNRFDRIVGVDGLNSDGQDLAQRLSLRDMDYASAVKLIIADQLIQELISDGMDLSITVNCGDENRGQTMLRCLERCTKNEPNVHCRRSGDSESPGGHQYRHGYGHSSQDAAASQTPQSSETLSPTPAPTSSPTGSCSEHGGGQGEHTQKRKRAGNHHNQN